MKLRLSIILLTIAAATSAPALHAASDNASTKKERNYIREGNKLYNDKRYADAEVAYRKAIEENAMSDVAIYNLASALIKQAGAADPNSEANPMAEAQSLLQGIAKTSEVASLAENALYNLGNMAFNQQQYDQAINMYKGALRKNPDNDKARENLRLAQLKKQEQEQNQDQNQQQQDQQDQNQDQNQQQQNQDQQKQDDNKDQQKDENQQGQDKKENDKQQDQQPRQEQGSISDANAAKILKTMENEENATRKKVQELKKREEEASRRQIGKQW